MQRNVNSILEGRLPSSRLPQTLDIWDLKGSFAELLQQSERDEVEWGSCILLEEGRLGLVHPVSGWREGVSPCCRPEDHERYVGFAHVHLPDEEGRPYPGFSERDYRAAVADGDHLSLVCNGPEVFALVRTADRTRGRGLPSDSEFKKWQSFYDEQIEKARQRLRSNRQDDLALGLALWEANREMCRLLGYAFYYGRWGEPLVRVFRPA